jgi:hypothetical protein
MSKISPDGIDVARLAHKGVPMTKPEVPCSEVKAVWN